MEVSTLERSSMARCQEKANAPGKTGHPTLVNSIKVKSTASAKLFTDLATQPKKRATRENSSLMCVKAMESFACATAQSSKANS